MIFKSVGLLAICLSFSILSYAQKGQSINKSQPEEDIIELPDWFGESEAETIQKIEARDSIDWSEYIQLAVSYSQLNAEKSKIEEMIEKSLIANTNNSCRHLRFILENQPEWKMTKNHKKLVEEQLAKYACPKL